MKQKDSAGSSHGMKCHVGWMDLATVRRARGLRAVRDLLFEACGTIR